MNGRSESRESRERRRSLAFESMWESKRVACRVQEYPRSFNRAMGSLRGLSQATCRELGDGEDRIASSLSGLQWDADTTRVGSTPHAKPPYLLLLSRAVKA